MFSSISRNIDAVTRMIRDKNIKFIKGDENNLLHNSNDMPALILENGNRMWFYHGKRHRENGPAIEWNDGGKDWYYDDQLHREGGPAVESASGTKAWYINGKLHREDGPAYECVDGTKHWFLNGAHYETPDKMPLSFFLAYVKWMKDHE